LETLSKGIILCEVKMIALVLFQQLTSGIERKRGVVTVIVIVHARPTRVVLMRRGVVVKGCRHGNCDSPCDAYPCGGNEGRCCCEGMLSR
jgi:hypothetical protein